MERQTLKSEDRKRLGKLISFKKKVSPVWNHFASTDVSTIMKCIHCHRTLTISYGSTGSLNRHMRMKHPKIAVYDCRTEKDRAGDKPSLNFVRERHNQVVQPNFTKEIDESHNEVVQAVMNIDNSTAELKTTNHEIAVSQEQQQMQYYILEPVNDSKTIEINKQLMKMIVKNLQPFSIVENPEFRKFVNILNPAYSLPSCKDLKNFLPEIYKTVENDLKCTLMEVTAVALTTDRWKSVNDERWISVTAHYLNQNFQFQSSFLSCISFPEKHSSSNIAAFLQSTTVEWGISDKVIAIVTENVPSMNRAAKECKWVHISCFASVLDKIVNTCILDIKPLLEKIRQIVAHFKINSTALQMLLEIQSQKNLSDTKLKLDISKRWNSTFEMMAAFFQNKEPIIITLNMIQNITQLSNSEWISLEKAIKLLIIFNSVAVEISSENALSLSKVPYMVKFMMKHVSNILAQNELSMEIESMAMKFKRELQNYSNELESNNVIGQNVLLDPRFKKRGISDSSFEEVYSSLCKDISLLKINKMKKVESNQPKIKNYTTKSKYFIDIWSEFEEKIPIPQNNVDEAATSEINSFFSDEYQSVSENPTTYWGTKLNQSKYPSLFELVKKRLCVPATAISGQTFTKQGKTLLEKKKCLISNKVQEILFLHHNL